MLVRVQSRALYLTLALSLKERGECRSGEIGRHARFRGVCRKVWGFESPLRHGKTQLYFSWVFVFMGIGTRSLSRCRSGKSPLRHGENPVINLTGFLFVGNWTPMSQRSPLRHGENPVINLTGFYLLGIGPRCLSGPPFGTKRTQL